MKRQQTSCILPTFLCKCVNLDHVEVNPGFDVRIIDELVLQGVVGVISWLDVTPETQCDLLPLLHDEIFAGIWAILISLLIKFPLVSVHLRHGENLRQTCGRVIIPLPA